jgi:serine protease Do
MSLISELQDAADHVLTRVGPATVRIGRGRGRGAGVVIGDGVVLTNAHNLRDRTTSVTFADGRTEQATVTAADFTDDLAVLSVDTTGSTPVEWATGDPALTVGTVVFTVTSPPVGGTRVTWGAVSGVDRSFRGPQGRPIRSGVEHTAPLRRGASGGPLVDADGRLVALNTHRLGDGFYLAQPADDDLRARVAALESGEAPRRAFLGVALAPAHAARRMREAVGLEPREGLLVRGVEDGSAADRAGIRRGDLLVTAGDTDLLVADDLFGVLDDAGADGTLTLKLLRGADELTVEVSLAAPTGEADDAEADIED